MNTTTLTRAIRKESLNIPTGLYVELLDEFSLKSFSTACLLDVQTSKLQRLLDKIRKINKEGG